MSDSLYELPPELTERLEALEDKMEQRTVPRWILWAILLALLLLAVGGGCTKNPYDLGPRIELVNPIPFVPDEGWRVWYTELEACAGMVRDYDYINWIWVDAVLYDGDSKAGMFKAPTTIVIRTGLHAPELLRVAKHEALHYIIREPGHPQPPFGPRGSTTACAINATGDKP